MLSLTNPYLRRDSLNVHKLHWFQKIILKKLTHNIAFQSDESDIFIVEENEDDERSSGAASVAHASIALFIALVLAVGTWLLKCWKSKSKELWYYSSWVIEVRQCLWECRNVNATCCEDIVLKICPTIKGVFLNKGVQSQYAPYKYGYVLHFGCPNTPFMGKFTKMQPKRMKINWENMTILRYLYTRRQSLEAKILLSFGNSLLFLRRPCMSCQE